MELEITKTNSAGYFEELYDELSED